MFRQSMTVRSYSLCYDDGMLSVFFRTHEVKYPITIGVHYISSYGVWKLEASVDFWLVNFKHTLSDKDITLIQLGNADTVHRVITTKPELIWKKS